MKTAIVTGASGGIGRAVALELARKGYALGINCNKDEKGLSETAAMISELGVPVESYIGDVSDPDFVRAMFESFAKAYAGVDVLVNNAGVAKIELLSGMTDDDITRIVGTNLNGVIFCSREAYKLMVAAKSGHIINISSMWGQCGASCETVYSATKGGVDAFTKALAKELAPSNIAVNAIAPGVTDTKMNSMLSEEEKCELAAEIPAGRFGTPEEVAEAVVAFAEMSPFLTGQIIRMDGGMI